MTPSSSCRLACDVLVVGAGPAGSAAAQAAAAAGARVLQIDRRRQVGLPVQCAEFVPLQLFELLPHIAPSRAQPIKSMLTCLPDGTLEETRALGYIVNRDRFDQCLAEAARSAGAELLLEARAVARQGETIQVRHQGATLNIKAAVVIGADGPRSTVGAWIGASNSQLVAAMQHRVPLRATLTGTRVYFDPGMPGGYGWLFPKGASANLGVGVDPGFGVHPRQALAALTAKLAGQGLIEARVQGSAGGLIPVGGPLVNQRQNVLLVGDAAGHCHPLTGAGVALAVQGGSIAGEAAAKAALAGSLSLLDGYRQASEELFGAPLRHAAARRRWLRQYWLKPPAELQQALKRAWVAFPDYYS